MLELMDEVVVEQTVFELIDGTSGLHGQLFEPDPDQESTADVIALNARLTALAAR